MAVAIGNTNLVDLLLKKNANVHMCDDDRSRPILLVAKWGHIEVIRILLNRNADINTPALNGDTPLYVAINKQTRDTEIVKLILNNNATVHPRGQNG